MNNFDKEELKIFLSFLKQINDVWRVMKPESEPKHFHLENKVKFMIDNYDIETIMVRGEKRDLSEFDNE